MKRIPGPLFALVRKLVPIACVDVLPTRGASSGQQIGLIRRLGEDGRRTGWALPGGRIRAAETLPAAVARHLTTTLGPGVRWTPPATDAPAHAAEYAPLPREGQLLDPRQHAIALSYVVDVGGDIVPRGEALEFRWFRVGERPRGDDLVFGQSAVLEALVARDDRLRGAGG